MSGQVFSSPAPEFVSSKTLWCLPVQLAEVVHRVFREKSGNLYLDQLVKVGIAGGGVDLLLLPPGVDQVSPGAKFAVETAGARRVLATDLKLAGAFHQAVSHPGLVGRIIGRKRSRGQVKGVAVRDTVAGVDPVVAGRQQQAGKEQNPSHHRSVRHAL